MVRVGMVYIALACVEMAHAAMALYSYIACANMAHVAMAFTVMAYVLIAAHKLYTHTRERTRTHARARARAHTHICARAHARTRARRHTHTHTHTQLHANRRPVHSDSAAGELRQPLGPAVCCAGGLHRAGAYTPHHMHAHAHMYVLYTS